MIQKAEAAIAANPTKSIFKLRRAKQKSQTDHQQRSYHHDHPRIGDAQIRAVHVPDCSDGPGNPGKRPACNERRRMRENRRQIPNCHCGNRRWHHDFSQWHDDEIGRQCKQRRTMEVSGHWQCQHDLHQRGDHHDLAHREAESHHTEQHGSRDTPSENALEPRDHQTQIETKLRLPRPKR